MENPYENRNNTVISYVTGKPVSLNPSQNVTETVTETAHQHWKNVTQTQLNKAFVTERTLHSARNKENRTPVVKFATAGTVFFFCCALYATANLMHTNLQISLYLTALALALHFDVFNFFGRFLPKQSRFLIAVLVIGLIVRLYVWSDPFTRALKIYTGVALILIVSLNGRWMDAETWLMSAAVEKALVNDPEGKASQAWNDFGKREARTIAHELGYSMTDEQLNGIARAFYLVGFNNGWKKLEKGRTRLEKAENTADSLKLKHKDDQKRISELTSINKALRDDEEEKDSMYMAMQTEIKELRKKLEKAKQKNDRLQQANDEILQSMVEGDTTAEKAVLITKEQKEKAKEQARMMFLNGSTVREVEEVTGLSHHTAAKISKEIRAQAAAVA